MTAHKREEVFTLPRKRVSVEVEVEIVIVGPLAPGAAAAMIKWTGDEAAEREVSDITDIAEVGVEIEL
jgi:hypothetical protein